MTIAHPGPEPGGPSLEIVALGGLGEFGLNMLAVSCGETTVVIDAGGMFPGPELPGVDLIVQDLTYLQDRRVSALVLTHGHEDHIGGVPYLLPLVDGRIYALGNRCPHRGGPLIRGTLQETEAGTVVRCPMHGWSFSLATGESARPGRATVYPVRVEGAVVSIAVEVEA